MLCFSGALVAFLRGAYFQMSFKTTVSSVGPSVVSGDNVLVQPRLSAALFGVALICLFFHFCTLDFKQTDAYEVTVCTVSSDLEVFASILGGPSRNSSINPSKKLPNICYIDIDSGTRLSCTWWQFPSCGSCEDTGVRL